MAEEQEPQPTIDPGDDLDDEEWVSQTIQIETNKPFTLTVPAGARLVAHGFDGKVVKLVFRVPKKPSDGD